MYCNMLTHKLITKIALILLLGMYAAPARAEKADYRIVPSPREVREGKSSFRLDAGTVISYTAGNAGAAGNADMERNAGFLAQYIYESAGLRLQTTTAQPKKNAIVLALDPKVEAAEGYCIVVNSKGMTVTAATPAGIFYGIQTIRKSMPVKPADGVVDFPAVTIKDSPRFAYRGAHFDVSRHFFTVDEVKTYIDMMALHNMNKFHWHITDDQGWRIEIKKYPKLTEVGSMRDETWAGHLYDANGWFDGTPHGGFYTQEQAKEIVKYAADRYIEVIPEVDLPGHMQAVLASYPELGCTGGPYKVWTTWGVSNGVLCAGNAAIYEFLDGVFSEILDIFSSEYVHIGGDECPKDNWENCPKCQARIAEEGLVSDDRFTKEQKLQSVVMKHVTSFLAERGRKVIGWDEILEGEVADGAIVMSWRGVEGGIAAAKIGHDAIMTPGPYLYFDYCQAQNKFAEPLSIGGYTPVRKVYEYDPLPAELTADQKRHIIGLQSNLWTEYIPTFSQAQYMVLPRWAALAENQWTYPEHKDYDAFVQRVARLRKIYDLEGYNYARHIFETAEPYHLISGKVACDGEGLAGVVVSDGKNCVATDENGVYQLYADKESRFVYVSTPAGYIPDRKEGTIPVFYHELDNFKDTYDFALSKNPLDDSDHVCIIQADIQLVDIANLDVYQNLVDDFKALRNERYAGKDVFGIDVGDIVGDSPWLYPPYIKRAERMDIPIYRCIGNHDMDYYGRTFETSYRTFNRYFGPECYSFNKGMVHYVVLDNNFFIGRDYFYMGYIPEKTFRWLEQDLSYMPDNHELVLIMHMPMRLTESQRPFTYNYDNIADQTVNAQALQRMLWNHRTHLISGHMHYNSNIVHVWNLFEHNTAAVCGTWWCSDICLDGTPSGYGVYEFSGKKVKWYYKSTGKPESYQARAYLPGASKECPSDVVANVWNYDPEWKVELLEDGVATCEMTQFTGYDPLASRLCSDRSIMKYDWISPVTTGHLFRATPQNPAARLQVRVTDRFGNVSVAEAE